MKEVGKDWQEYLHQKCNHHRNTGWSRPVMKEGVNHSMYLRNIQITQMLNEYFLSWQLRPSPQLDRMVTSSWKIRRCVTALSSVMESREGWSTDVSGELLSGPGKKQRMGHLWITLPRMRNGLTELGMVGVGFYFWFWDHITDVIMVVVPDTKHKTISFPCSLSPWLNDW